MDSSFRCLHIPLRALAVGSPAAFADSHVGEDRQVVRVLVGPPGSTSEPNTKADVFRRFADLGIPLADAALVAFANRYGYLSGPMDLELWPEALKAPETSAGLLRYLKPSGPIVVLRGELVGLWEGAINDAQRVLWAWDYLQSRPEGIAHEILWSPSTDALREMSANLRRGYRKGYLARTRALREQIASRFIADVTSRGLRESTSPKIVAKADDHTRFEYGPEATTLLGQIWEQVARCVCGGADFPRCEGCQRRFPMTRRDKRSCKDSCRAMVSKRNRASEARRQSGLQAR